MPSRPLIIVDISAPGLDGILTEFGSEATAPDRIFNRNDGNEFDWMFVERTGNPTAPFRVADLTGYTIQTALGDTDEPPESGTFGLSYNASTTGLTGLAYNITAANLKTALESNTTLTTISTVTVNTGTDVFTTGAAHNLSVGDRIRFTNSGGGLPAPLVAGTSYYVISVPLSTTFTISATSGGAILDITTAGTGTHTVHGTLDVEQFGYNYQVSFKTTGTKYILVSDSAGLVPACYVSVIQAQVGDSDTQEIQWIRLVQKPLGYTNSFVAGSVGSADVEVLQEGTDTLAEVQRISLNLPSYDGSIIVNIGTRQEIEVSCVADVAGSLTTKGIIVEDSNGTVGIGMLHGGAGTLSAELLACNRQITITGTSNGMSAANIATQWQTAVDADSEFVVTRSGNVLKIRQASAGSRIDATDVGTGFTLETLQRGVVATSSIKTSATAAEMAGALGNVVNVLKSGAYQWDVYFQAPGDQDLITVTANSLFQTVYTASIDLSNNQTLRRFASEDATTEFVTVPWEISITPSGGKPVTVYRKDHDIYRDVITNDVSAATPLPTSITKLEVNNSIFVDADFGSDSGDNIGLRQRMDRPFLTPAAAKAAALAGDCIYIRNGDYTANTSLAADDVHWRLEGDAQITWTSASGAMFNDGGTAMAFTVKGGRFIINEGTSSGSPLVICSHASSNILFETDSATGNAANQLFQQSNGTLTLRIKNSSHDANGPSLLSFSGGTCLIDGGYHDYFDADASVKISGTTAGTIEFRDTKIRNTHPSGFPVEIANGTTNKTMIFDGGRYVSDAGAANSIAANDSQTIYITSPIATNTGIDSFITVAVNAGHTESTSITF